MNMPYCVSFVGHVDQDAVPQPVELVHAQVTLELGVATVMVAVDTVLTLELGPVGVEAVSDEQRNIVFRRVAGCGTQHDPTIVLSDLDERLRPSARPDDTLLIKYDEVTGDAIVLRHVVV
jgi:hypothetical protein